MIKRIFTLVAKVLVWGLAVVYVVGFWYSMAGSMSRDWDPQSAAKLATFWPIRLAIAHAMYGERGTIGPTGH
jgi:hypothetical protein